MNELSKTRDSAIDGVLKNSSFCGSLEGWPAAVSVCAVCVVAIAWKYFEYKTQSHSL